MGQTGCVAVIGFPITLWVKRLIWPQLSPRFPENPRSEGVRPVFRATPTCRLWVGAGRRDGRRDPNQQEVLMNTQPMNTQPALRNPNRDGIRARRLIRPDAHSSDVEDLVKLVECEWLWALLKDLEERFVVARRGPPRRYRLMDIFVMAAAVRVAGNVGNAEAFLNKPTIWWRLRSAASAAFPTDPARRLSPTPPSRFQYHRARRSLLTRGLLDELQRRVRTRMVETVQQLGLSDPNLWSPRRGVSPRRDWREPSHRVAELEAACRGFRSGDYRRGRR